MEEQIDFIISNIKKHANSDKELCPKLREGQALYNAAYRKLKDWNLAIFDDRSVDCFCDDLKIPKFIQSLKDEMFNILKN